MMKYFSIDIETTGLDTSKAELLQVAIVYDDGNSEIEKLPRYSVVVKAPAYQYGEPYALAMNSGLFYRIAQGEGVSATAALGNVNTFIQKHSNGERLPAAGANAAQFDIPILSRFGLNKKLLSHRVIDVATLYLQETGEMLSLNRINDITGRPKVSHDALQDALDVVHAIRRALNKEKK